MSLLVHYFEGGVRKQTQGEGIIMISRRDSRPKEPTPRLGTGLRTVVGRFRLTRGPRVKGVGIDDPNLRWIPPDSI